MQLAQHKINVNNIALAAIPLSIKRYLMIPPQIRTPSVIPWGRFGRPEKVASVAVFLGSNEAEYVTGSTYLIDGGLTGK